MCHYLLLLFSLFVTPVALFTIPLDAQADPADPGEIAHMRSGHQKVEGVVTDVRSGLYTVRTPTGTTYTLAESVAVRYGREVPKVGDEMILWINEGNNIMDANKKGASKMTPHFISGNLVSINYGQAQVRLSISGEEKSFKLRPESQKYTDMAVGTPVTIAVNEVGEVVDLHVDKASGAPRSGLDHPDNESALKGFRHLGNSE